MEELETETDIDKLFASLPDDRLDEIANSAPKPLAIAGSYKKQMQDAYSGIQDVSKKTYAPSPELTEQISGAKADYDMASKSQGEDMWAKLISSFGPAILGGLSGEAGKMAQAPATKASQDLYAAQRKDNQAQQDKVRKEAAERYKSLVDSKKSERESFEKRTSKEIDGLKAQASGARDMAGLDVRASATGRSSKGKDGRPLPLGGAENMSASKNALSSLEDALSLTSENEDMFGKGVGVMGNIGIATGVGDLATKAASIDAALKVKAQTIGRYLEGGKLAEGDIKRYKEMLPERGDKPDIVKNKIANLQREIENKYNNDLSAYQSAGYNTGDSKKLEVGPGLTGKVGKDSKKVETKDWNGKTYKKVGDEWVAQ